MKYVIMAIGEDGSSFNAGNEVFFTKADALAVMDDVAANYPDARSIWVEVYRDSSFYTSQLWDDEESWESEESY